MHSFVSETLCANYCLSNCFCLLFCVFTGGWGASGAPGMPGIGLDNMSNPGFNPGGMPAMVSDIPGCMNDLMDNSHIIKKIRAWRVVAVFLGHYQHFICFIQFKHWGIISDILF